jgi:hypothetical protein
VGVINIIKRGFISGTTGNMEIDKDYFIRPPPLSYRDKVSQIDATYWLLKGEGRGEKILL